MGKRVLFLRSNPIAPDPRVEKEASALSKANYQVRILGWDEKSSLPIREYRSFGIIERLRTPGRSSKGLGNLPQMLRFQMALLSYLWRNRKSYDIIHACDFDTILPALIIRFLLGKILIYDIFDFYADMVKYLPASFRKAIRFLEIMAINLADGVILADEARLKQIKGSHPKRLCFIYNSIPLAPDITLPKEPPPFRIAYVGILQRERGIFHLISLMEKHPEWELHIAGFGEDENFVREKAATLTNIHYYGRVAYEQALKINSLSHAMFATYDPSIPNHAYSSANKLFEAMALGKPIIVARGTNMDRTVAQYQLGRVVEYGNISELEEALIWLQSWDSEERRLFAERTRRIYERNFDWKIMEERLLDFYKEIVEGDHRKADGNEAR
jgi:glycosyltransferase involved in cell wall biosynthesis